MTRCPLSPAAVAPIILYYGWRETYPGEAADRARKLAAEVAARHPGVPEAEMLRAAEAAVGLAQEYR